MCNNKYSKNGNKNENLKNQLLEKETLDEVEAREALVGTKAPVDVLLK